MNSKYNMMCTFRLRHNLSLILFITLILVLDGVVALAQKEQTGKAGTEITSERVTVRNKDRQAVFEENVVLTQGSLEVKSDKMVVFYESTSENVSTDPGGENANDAQSKDGNLDVKKIEAIGNVRIKRDDGRATCRKAVFYQLEQKIVLTGDPVAWQEGNRVAGDRITLFLKDERTVVEGRSRVTLENVGGAQ